MNFVNLKKCLLLSTAVLAFENCANASEDIIFNSPYDNVNVVDSTLKESHVNMQRLIEELNETSKEFLDSWDNAQKVKDLCKEFNINSNLVNDNTTMEILFDSMLISDCNISRNISNKYVFVQHFFNTLKIIKFIMDHTVILNQDNSMDTMYKFMCDIVSTCNIDRAIKLVNFSYDRYKNNDKFDIVQEIVSQIINNSKIPVHFVQNTKINPFADLCYRLFNDSLGSIFVETENHGIAPMFYQSTDNQSISQTYYNYYNSLNQEQSKLSSILEALDLRYLYINQYDRSFLLTHRIFDGKHDDVIEWLTNPNTGVQYNVGAEIMSAGDLGLFLLKRVQEFENANNGNDNIFNNTNIGSKVLGNNYEGGIPTTTYQNPNEKNTLGNTEHWDLNVNNNINNNKILGDGNVINNNEYNIQNKEGTKDEEKRARIEKYKNLRFSQYWLEKNRVVTNIRPVTPNDHIDSKTKYPDFIYVRFKNTPFSYDSAMRSDGSIILKLPDDMRKKQLEEMFPGEGMLNADYIVIETEPANKN